MGLKIKERREAQSLSQATLAANLGVNQTAVSQWERGVSAPRASQLPALAAALHCSIDELYSEEKEENS